MASEKIEIVRRFVSPMIGRDLVPVFADETQRDALATTVEPMLDPEYEFVAATSGMAAIELSYRGRREALEGFLTGWGEWLSAWDAFVIEIEEILELEDGRVLVLTRSHSRSTGAGLEMDGEHGLIFSVRNGKLLHFVQYLDRSEALEAAGVTYRENQAP
jgi:ketosteroid isomerase-like protein